MGMDPVAHQYLKMAQDQQEFNKKQFTMFNCIEKGETFYFMSIVKNLTANQV